jgi:hypothetical protein
MIDSLIYCVGNEVFIYLVVDLPQASTRTKNCTVYKSSGDHARANRSWFPTDPIPESLAAVQNWLLQWKPVHVAWLCEIPLHKSHRGLHRIAATLSDTDSFAHLTCIQAPADICSGSSVHLPFHSAHHLRQTPLRHMESKMGHGHASDVLSVVISQEPSWNRS